ncbi:MAG: hypothetical protein QOK47_615 [Actinomycetota bacterium]|nr:hypothetical protein [Actinomycetota bacterium]
MSFPLITERGPVTIRKSVPVLILALIASSLVAVPTAEAKKRPKCFGRVATKVGTKKAELLTGTSKADVIVALGGADQIEGKGGNDLICGGGGGDLILGSEGDDRIDGQGGNDSIFGMEGNDEIKLGGGRINDTTGGPGDDVLTGGNGFDLAGYVDAPNGVNVDLAAGTASGGDGADTLSGIDGVAGSGADDTLRGTAGTNLLFGAGGNDSIFTGGNTGNFATPTTPAVDVVSGDGDPQAPPGNDTLTGGAGMNIVDYSFSETAVQVDLSLGTANGEGLDTLSGFQVVVGSEFDDSLTGDGNDNAFQPYLGNDDVDGGGGADLAVFASAANSVVADLATGNATGEGTDTLSGIENLWGSPSADTLTGDDGPNAIYSLGGNDRITAAAGDDRLDGGTGIDALDGGDGNDRCSAGETNTNCELSQAATSPSLLPQVWRMVQRLGRSTIR